MDYSIFTTAFFVSSFLKRWNQGSIKEAQVVTADVLVGQIHEDRIGLCSDSDGWWVEKQPIGLYTEPLDLLIQIADIFIRQILLLFLLA